MKNATSTDGAIATAFAAKDGTVRKKSRFILGVSAVANIGGRQFAIVAPSVYALEMAWLDAVKRPLDKSRVQQVGLVAQEKIQ